MSVWPMGTYSHKNCKIQKILSKAIFFKCEENVVTSFIQLGDQSPKFTMIAWMCWILQECYMIEVNIDINIYSPVSVDIRLG
jgi:hypothetical protein